MEFLSIRDAYHDIMELLHKIMFIDYNTARERNRFPWEQQDWNEGTTTSIGKLIENSIDGKNTESDYEKELKARNEFEQNRQKKIQRLKKWSTKNR